MVALDRKDPIMSQRVASLDAFTLLLLLLLISLTF